MKRGRGVSRKFDAAAQRRRAPPVSHKHYTRSGAVNKKLLITAIVVTSLALAALLAYSIERTAWLFGRFEDWAPAAYAAALVVELAAVALIVGASALAHLDRAARAWANRALVAVLSVGALANLAAGYLRGGRATLAQFGSAAEWAPYGVAASLWLTTNLAIPGLILCLSKLLERLVVALADRRRTLAAQRRTLIVRLLHALRAERATTDQVRQGTAQIQATAASLEQTIARASEAAAQQAADLARQQQEIARLQSEAAQQTATIAQQDQEIARLREEVAQAATSGPLDTTAIARALREPRAIDWRTIESLLGVAQATLRGRVERAERNGNGHLVEG